MSSRVRLFPVIVILFVIIASGLIILRQMNGNIKVLEGEATEMEKLLREKQDDLSEAAAIVKNKDSAAYIIEQARANGYLMPGEYLFVVTNPEVLYETPEAVLVETGGEAAP